MGQILAPLSPYMTVRRHVFFPDMIVPRHVLCPDTLVPQHELLWPDTIMSLVNNNIVIVSTRLIMCQLHW